MKKLSWGQVTVLAVAAVLMTAVGATGVIATYVNMNNALHRSASAAGLVAAGEGATFISALVALAVTLMGQHTPMVARLGMWVIPMVASGVGVALAPTHTDRVVMAITPLAMTAAGEGITFVARRVVAYRTSVDIEQRRRSGLLLWHANRAANGSWPGRKLSTAAVWRLSKQVASTDGQLSVQLGEIQRYRISEGMDANLAAILTKRPESPSLPLAPATPAIAPATSPKAVQGPSRGPEGGGSEDDEGDDADGGEWIQKLLDEQSARAAEAKPLVKLLSGDDVAVLLNVKPGTIRTWVHRDKLRVHDRDENGRALFHPDDVARLSGKTG
jgi:hypothetical protein